MIESASSGNVAAFVHCTDSEIFPGDFRKILEHFRGLAEGHVTARRKYNGGRSVDHRLNGIVGKLVAAPQENRVVRHDEKPHIGDGPADRLTPA